MKVLAIVLSFFSLLSYSQELNNAIDVTAYEVEIRVNDSSDYIFVTEYVYLAFNSNEPQFYLDLSTINGVGKGMSVSNVLEDDKLVNFTHTDDKLWITPESSNKNNSSVFTIEYQGIPIDGLIIGENRYGNRTFFGDNWPNRAHHWFACNDHPSDKAVIQFTVTAPSHYEVIATGTLLEQHKNTNATTTHSFASKTMLSTKVMVIGIADFAIQEEDYIGFPLSSWVYREDSSNAFHDLEPATGILDFFIDNIADYPFKELANVQSTTRYGGMENASNIFYDEFAFSGAETMEALIAHEIAHQWFGNSATESDWSHLWLSEGFATYLTDLYWENKYGVAEMQKRLISERKKVIELSKIYNHSIIDTNYTQITSLLNANSYQKGAWVLHMLRQKIGDRMFLASLQNYYEAYSFGNASSDDFIKIVEETSKKDLSVFFNQWLKKSGQPILKSSFSQNKKTINLWIEQVQSGMIFEFPIEIEIVFKDGTSKLVELRVDTARTEFTLDSQKKVDKIILDPNVKLLFEEL